jgi:hypothetical protein
MASWDVVTSLGRARFAGTPAPPPMPGNRIRILRGENRGVELEVLDLVGNVYRSDFRVIVRNLEGELVWYYPWDVIIVKCGNPIPPL